MHLGGSEPTYFAPGSGARLQHAWAEGRPLHLCGLVSRPTLEAYASLGATVYAAGMFLNAEWYATDAPRLAGYAPRFRMLVVMANHAGSAGTYVSVGKSSVWAPDGTPSGSGRWHRKRGWSSPPAGRTYVAPKVVGL